MVFNKSTREIFPDKGVKDVKDSKDSKDSKNSEAVDVAIIGAGWAGLAAASTLKENGVTFTVLEARDYVGGRSVTTYELGQDVPIDLGSGWIHGKRRNPVQSLVEKNGIPHASTMDTDAVFDSNGSSLRPSQSKKILKYRNDFMKYMRRRQYLDSCDTSLQKVLDDYVKKAKIHDGADGRDGLQWLLDTEVSQEYAAPLSQLSLYYWDIDEELSGGDTYLSVPEGGYSRLVASFAAPVMPDVRLHSKVTCIEHEGRAAVVRYVDTANGNRSISIRAKHVLVTVPLGVLKAGMIKFYPALPQSKRDSISALGSGLLNKCVLYWEDMHEQDIFWPKEKEWIMRIAPKGEQGKWTEFFNAYDINGGKPVLVGFVAGDHASRMEKLSDEEVTAEAVESLRCIFGANKVPEPTNSIVTRWGSDEFARGSYSFQQVGSGKSSRKRLAKPVGDRLWFAGEATDTKYPGTTHGAMMSGQKAAHRIMSKL